MHHLLHVIMWVGGYDDWTPTEQREWDRDIEELEAERERRESAMKTENENELHWLELAIDYPLFNATYTRVKGTNLYVVDLNEVSPSKDGTRNLDFEIVYPLYHRLNDIIETRKTPKTTLIKIVTSSREHFDVTYTCEFPLDQWGYNKMDELTEALTDQLIMKQDLNRGLLMSLYFYEE